MKRFLISEEEKKHIMGLYESTVVTDPSTNEWCKANVKDTSNQICIIKTPNSADQMTCQKQVGSIARPKGYPHHVTTDVKETNFCKSVWSKTLK